MRAFVFINYEVVPGGAGHVGWGFETSPGQFCYGAKEMSGFGGAGVLPGGDNKVFVVHGDEGQMLAAMRDGTHPGGSGWPYHACVAVPVANPDPAGAVAMAEDSKSWGYFISGNNCMDDAYRILMRYSRGQPILPDVKQMANWVPVHWFGNIQGQRLDLRPRSR